MIKEECISLPVLLPYTLMDIHVTHTKVTKIHKTPIPQQTASWSEAKRRQGIRSRAFTIETDAKELFGGSRSDELQDDVLVRFQDAIDGDTIGYVPYCPKLLLSNENKGGVSGRTFRGLETSDSRGLSSLTL